MKSVTVVIPTFNSMKFIKKCVDSVLAQTYRNMKIWACDNESSDGTCEYLRLVEKENPKLEVYSLPNIIPNGYREAIEFVFQHAETDFITFVCSDDFISQSYVSNCMKYVNHDINLKCLQSPLTCVDENDQNTGQTIYHHYNNLDEFKKEFLQRSPVCNPSVFYHKDLWKFIKDGREAHKINNLIDMGAGDYDLWGCFASNNIFIFPVQSFLGYFYRWHPGQCTWIVQKQSIKYDKIIQNYYKVKWGLK